MFRFSCALCYCFRSCAAICAWTAASAFWLRANSSINCCMSASCSSSALLFSPDMSLSSPTAVALLLPFVLAAGPTPRLRLSPQSTGGGVSRAGGLRGCQFLAGAAEACKALARFAPELALLGIKGVGRGGEVEESRARGGIYVRRHGNWLARSGEDWKHWLLIVPSRRKARKRSWRKRKTQKLEPNNLCTR